MAGSIKDVAIIGYAQARNERQAQATEVQFLFPVINEALEMSKIPRRDIGFTCAGSCDYLSGQTFAFVMNLEAVGAWPPISESHVEMDGAWALYEAWVRLQHGDVDVALVFGSGMASRANLREVLCLQNDPYYLMPLWTDHVSLAALQARALLDSGKATEADLQAVVERARANAAGNPNAQPLDDARGDDDAFVVEPLRVRDCAPVGDGAAAAILVAGDRARDVCERPAWIAGIDHRVDPHYPGVRDLTRSHSAAVAAQQAGVDKAPVEVAELHAAFSHEELILRDALGLDDSVEVNPSGGALMANPMMSAGLIRIGEAFRQISEHGKHRTVAHATSGPCLQQNLVCVLEGDR
jgi:acetyl-CoA acetyltransferase